MCFFPSEADTEFFSVTESLLSSRLFDCKKIFYLVPANKYGDFYSVAVNKIQFSFAIIPNFLLPFSPSLLMAICSFP